MSNHDLPRRGSSPHICLSALNNIGGTASMQALMKVRNWNGPAARFRLDVVDRLALAGLIAIVGEQCAVTPAGRAYLGIKQVQIDGPAAVAAGPRYVAQMRPLNIARHYPVGMIRPGSLDYRDIPSKIGHERVAYRGPVSMAGDAQ